MAVVAIDLDDVVLDFTGTWQRLYRTWFDQEPDEWTSWDGAIGSPVFDSKEAQLHWFERIGGYAQMNRNPAYLAGAPGAIERLMERCTVHFVTARPDVAAVSAEAWWRNSPWRDRTFLTCTPNKETVKAAVYVDDSPIVAKRLIDLGRNVVLMDRPWNQDFDNLEIANSHPWTRAHNWAEATEQIETFIHPPEKGK